MGSSAGNSVKTNLGPGEEEGEEEIISSFFQKLTSAPAVTINGESFFVIPLSCDHVQIPSLCAFISTLRSLRVKRLI